MIFPELANVTELAKLMVKGQTYGKSQTSWQERIQSHGKEKIPAPQPTLIDKLSMTSVVWNISIAQLGLSIWLCSLQLLHTCLLAEYGGLEKNLDFLATTENISFTSFLLTLNPKHSSYWQENSLYPSRKQDSHIHYITVNKERIRSEQSTMCRTGCITLSFILVLQKCLC